MANAVSSLELTPITDEPHATITVDGNPATSGSPAAATLQVGMNVLQVVVTAQDATTTQTYTLAVVRDQAAQPPLTDPNPTPQAPATPPTATPILTPGAGQHARTQAGRDPHLARHHQAHAPRDCPTALPPVKTLQFATNPTVQLAIITPPDATGL